MGCCGSSGEAYLVRLNQCESGLVSLRQRTERGASVNDLQQMRMLASELSNLYDAFSNDFKDPNEASRIKSLAERSVQDLVRFLTVEVIRRGDLNSFQTIIAAARFLDNIGVKASVLVTDRKKVLMTQIGKEHLVMAESILFSLTEPERLSAGIKQEIFHLCHVKAYMREVPELTSSLHKLADELAVKILSLLIAFAKSCPRKLKELRQNCEELDGICKSMVFGGSHGEWKLLTPKVEEAQRLSCLEQLPLRMDDVEEEISKGSAMEILFIGQILLEICDVWHSPSVEICTRFKGILKALSGAIRTTFAQAIDSGDSNKIDQLIQLGKEIDIRRQATLGSAETGDNLVRDLEEHRAGVTLKVLLANAKGTVERQQQDLHKKFLESEAKLKVLPRESYDEAEEPARWRFKLARGGFKDYSSEKSAEVEALYQSWLRDGRKATARYAITIQVQSVRQSSASRKARPRCKYGHSCFRKNPDHRKELSHPGDQDWDEEVSPSTNPILEAETALREEQFALDFSMMTQMNETRRERGMRIINRIEGMTRAEVITSSYFSKFIDFVKDEEHTFSQAQSEMHFLGEEERRTVQKQVDDLIQAMRPMLKEFLELALLTSDTKAIEEVIALLGIHAEALQVGNQLKEIRLADAIRELTAAFADRARRPQPLRWALVRMLCRRQTAGPKRLLECRLALTKTKQESMTLVRRQVQMRCQALLRDYEGDEDFSGKFTAASAQVLVEACQRAAFRYDAEALAGILRTATSWHCDTSPFIPSVGAMLVRMMQEACRTRHQTLARIAEVLDAGLDIAKAAQRQLPDLCKLATFTKVFAEEVMRDINLTLDQPGYAKKLPVSVKQVVELRAKLKSPAVMAGFDNDLWPLFKSWYEGMAAKGASTDKQTASVEWAIAFCEQLRTTLPPWLMKKDQVEAFRKLQSAVESKDERSLREAVIFAKQTDHTSDQKLLTLYDQAASQLRKLKRLPSGWEVDELVGDDATAKMFKQVDVGDAGIKLLFQKIFDTTKASIVTRDRVGDMPRGFRVERIISVWNADSWFPYCKRMDEITAQCKRFTGAAPCSPETWRSWSGPVMTESAGKDILAAARLPALTAGANEFLMFHGTKAEAADSIAQNHFDMAFACKTGLFGAGLYFAESSSKSDEYVKPNKNNHYPIIMCRVALGRINYSDHKDPVTDPGRDKLESSCLGGEYHSVLGDRKRAKGTYREFVVYDHYQVYPHFIVWYSRL